MKGCLSGRRENAEKYTKKGWADGEMNGDDDDDDEPEPGLVLKDANFHDKGVILNFGANRGWFVEQGRDLSWYSTHHNFLGDQPQSHLSLIRVPD